VFDGLVLLFLNWGGLWAHCANGSAQRRKQTNKTNSNQTKGKKENEQTNSFLSGLSAKSE